MDLVTYSPKDVFEDGEPVSGVQYAVADPDGEHFVYGDQSWVKSAGCIRDGSHPAGKIRRRTVTVSYGSWEDA